MEWLLDSYIVQAGDAAAAWAGRAFNFGPGRWETVSGVNMAPSRMTRHVVKSVDIRVQTSIGAVKNGVMVHGFLIGDPLHTGYVVPLFQCVQSKSRLVHWAGNQEMLAGITWRILAGGLAAGDVVDIGVGYV